MKEFESYKEMQNYTYYLNKKNRECTLTESDQLDYIDITKINDELQKIKDSIKDEYWLAILTSLMQSKTKKSYKLVYIERMVKANRGGKLIDVKLSYPFIVPEEFDENTITSEDILSAGELAKTYFDRGIVIYFSNNIQVGLPLDIENQYNEIVFNIYKANKKDNKQKKKSR